MKPKFQNKMTVSERNDIMKKIIYTDKDGNRVDITSTQELPIIFNDIFTVCNNEKECLNAKVNLKNIIKTCYKNRVHELNDTTKKK